MPPPPAHREEVAAPSGHRANKPVLIYDGACQLCRRWVRRWRARTLDRVEYLPLQRPDVLQRFGISRSDALRSVQLVTPDHRRYSGAEAVFRTLEHVPELVTVSRIGQLPVLRQIAELGYRWIARHRSIAGRIDRWLFGDGGPPIASRSGPTTRRQTMQIQDIMTKQVHAVRSDTTLSEVARLMRDRKIGDVLVTNHDGTLRGIVTDRDIVVRAGAVGKPLDRTQAGEICTDQLVKLTPTSTVDDAVKVMREHAVRRLPIVRDGHAIGIVTIGDLARHQDPKSALADISQAAPNN